MKICVINGSPKGKYSITLQTCNYLQSRFPKHSFTVLDAGQRIRAFERDFSGAREMLAAADVLLFSYPVYTFLAPSQLHRFIELMKSSGVDLSGKFASQITTSKHFYDVTAHRYIEENCRDMKLRVVHGLSADMDDLITEQGRADAVRFFRYLLWCVRSSVSEPELPRPLPIIPEIIPETVAVADKNGSFDTVIVADLREGDDELQQKIEYFKNNYPYTTRLVNIAEYPFAGGCLGCFKCAVSGRCVYRDGFDAFLREKIQAADATVYAFTVRDHSMGARFKMYDDRQFCNGHRTVTEGKPVAYIVGGSTEGEENLRTVLEARSEVGHNFLGGIACDAATLRSTALRLAYAVKNGYVQPRNFYGVGGMKIFRDLIWLMRGLMKADHEFYRQHGIYDFPQKKRAYMLKMCVLGAVLRNPKVNEKLGNRMNEAMLEPYTRAIRGGK